MTENPAFRSIFFVSKVTSREDTSEIISLGMVDLIIPRGSSNLVKTVVSQSQGVPVLGHAEGICHVYVDIDADLDKALHISKLSDYLQAFLSLLSYWELQKCGVSRLEYSSPVQRSF